MNRTAFQVTAKLASPVGVEEIRLELDTRFERNLVDILHAVACASADDKPGRTVERHIIWPREAGGGAAVTSIDERCNDCGKPIVWDETVQDYRHVDPAAVCFLIAAETEGGAR